MSEHNLSFAKIFRIGFARNPNSARRGIPFSALTLVDLGTPVAGTANSICASQAINAGALGLLNGSTAGTLDVPRNVVAAWTTTAVLTVTGIDAYGQRVTESSASGTSFTGKKAFKSITSVTVSANVTGATVGTGNVLGLPYRAVGRWDVINMWQDSTAETISAFAAADATSPPTATTGDVRGTVTPTTTPNGSVRFRVWMRAETNENGYGTPQFAA